MQELFMLICGSLTLMGICQSDLKALGVCLIFSAAFGLLAVLAV